MKDDSFGRFRFGVQERDQAYTIQLADPPDTKHINRRISAVEDQGTLQSQPQAEDTGPRHA